MDLRELGEGGLIRYLRKKITHLPQKALVGIGDDAAVLPLSAEKVLLFTTDTLVEGVHFQWKYTPAYHLGWKSLAVNLSDIAAMGGRPTYALINLGIPIQSSLSLIEELYRGLEDAASLGEVEIVGGDTVGSQHFFINISLLGESEKDKFLLRKGAKEGDSIYVTGTLGDSAAGLLCLKGKTGQVESKLKDELSLRHLLPTPRIREGRKIAGLASATAMIDVSDGLASDLGWIIEESGVGAAIYQDKIPLSPTVVQLSEQLKISPWKWALSGGEDYELLFTVSEGRNQIPEDVLDFPVTRIGVILPRQEGLVIIGPEGKKKRLRREGYDHFRRRPYAKVTESTEGTRRTIGTKGTR